MPLVGLNTVRHFLIYSTILIFSVLSCLKLCSSKEPPYTLVKNRFFLKIFQNLKVSVRILDSHTELTRFDYKANNDIIMVSII